MARRHQGAQLVVVERLGDVVEGAFAHGRDRRRHAAVGGEQDDRQGGAGGAQSAQQLDAVEVRHLEVGHHHVGAARVDCLERRCGAGARLALVAVAPQRHGHHGGHARLVVHDHHARLHARDCLAPSAVGATGYQSYGEGHPGWLAGRPSCRPWGPRLPPPGSPPRSASATNLQCSGRRRADRTDRSATKSSAPRLPGCSGARAAGASAGCRS